MSETNLASQGATVAPPPPPPPAQPEAEATPQATPAAPPPEGQKTEGESATPKPTDDDPAKASRRLQKRIDAANRRYGEEKARREYLEAELEKFKAPKAPPVEGEPRLEQFNDIEEYAKAKAEWRAGQARKEWETEERNRAQRAQVQRLSTQWQEKLAEASDRYDDFEDVVGDIQPTTALSVAIMRAPNGADIAYHLAKNQKEVMSLMSLEPVEQILAVGRLAAELAAKPPVAPPPSKAPPPIAPVTANAAPPSDAPSDDDDTATWIAKRRKQVYKKK